MGYVQDERYIAGEHMDVRRDFFSFAGPVLVVFPKLKPNGAANIIEHLFACLFYRGLTVLLSR